MKKILIWTVILSVLFSLCSVSAESITAPDLSVSTEDFDTLEPGETTVMSISQPVQAYLVVNTNCYLAPNPNTGHKLAAIPANTSVWVVEKAKCADNNMYYYYCGFTYNGASHRGYFSSDNVYRNGSQYLPEDVVNESNWAKEYTSLADTVYAGPATTYAEVGSVGQETIKVIRTEGDYNFIQYQVSTGKYKRGFLHYSKITGSWAALTAQNAELNGKTFYIRSGQNQQYWGTVNNGSAETTRIQMQDFTGDTGQIYKFIYDSTNKFFYIQPAVGYTAGNRVAIRWVSGTEHADRRLFLKPSAVVLRQQFWVVKVTGRPGCYKIVPRSSYGTMTLTARSGYVNQFYSTSSTQSADVWELELPEGYTSSAWVSQEGQPWCWAASAKMLASSENPQNYSVSLYDAIVAAKGSSSNTALQEGGTPTEIAKAANYFMNGSTGSNYFKGFSEPTNYPESILRRFILEDHSVSISLISGSMGTGHSINLVGFYWDDAAQKYILCYYDPNRTNQLFETTYSTLRQPTNDFAPLTGAFWKYTVVRNRPYGSNTITPLYY